MFRPSSLFIALRYAKARQRNSFVSFINGFSVAGITLGLMALITVVSIMNGFEAQLKQRVLGVVPHLLVSGEFASDNMRVQPNVKTVMPFEEAEAVVQSTSALRGVQLQGVDPAVMREHSIVTQHILLGDFDPQPGSFDVIIGRALASQLEIRLGSSLRILVAGKTVYTPFGRVPSQRLVRVRGIFDLASQVDDSVIYMHYKDVQKLQRKPEQTAQYWRIFLNDAFAFAKTQQWFEAQGAEVATWRERQGKLFDAVKMEKNMMFVMLLLIIAVAAFNVVSALVMVVSQKQGDIAILQTQGMRPMDILSIFLINGLMNGLKGAVLGSALGSLVVLFINPFLSAIGVNLALSAEGDSLPVVVDYAQIAVVIGFSLLLCLLASVYPAIRAMKMQPAFALHNA